MHHNARLLLVASTVLPLSVGAALVSSTPAQAADRCAVSVNVPKKVVVDRRYKEVKLTLVDPCHQATFASFDLYGRNGLDTIFWFDGTKVAYWDVYSFADLGSFKTRDSVAWDRDYNTLPVTETTTAVKLGTKAALSSSRKGSKVTLKATSTAYNPDSNKFTAWSASSATLQYKSGSSWKTLKKVKLASGKATYTVTAKSKRSYRFVTGETSTKWGAGSRTTVR